MANVLGTLFSDIANAIRNKTGSTEKLSPSEFASKIDGISVGDGGIPAGYKTVTFMNGDNVLFERLVLSGDDCPDPVTQGRIETPTKESTVQYHYTYKGWSEALTNITEDKVIYATFTESVRTYTVTFYDTDGTTVLNTQQVAYGGSSTYTYKKDGYSFVGWTPEPTNITGDLSCIGAWQESYAFADAPWSYIAQISESGKATETFAIGDKRTETLTYADGTTEQIELTIIGFDFDTKSDGTGKAGITVLSNVLTTLKKMSTTYSGTTEYPKTEVYTYLSETVLPALPTNLSTHIKGVDKIYGTAAEGSNYIVDESITNQKLWILDGAETYGINQSASYPYFFGKNHTEVKQKRIGYKIDGTISEYWIRRGSGSGKGVWTFIMTNGETSGGNYSKKYGVRFGFCI